VAAGPCLFYRLQMYDSLPPFSPRLFPGIFCLSALGSLINCSTLLTATVLFPPDAGLGRAFFHCLCFFREALPPPYARAPPRAPLTIPHSFPRRAYHFRFWPPFFFRNIAGLPFSCDFSDILFPLRSPSSSRTCLEFTRLPWGHEMFFPPLAIAQDRPCFFTRAHAGLFFHSWSTAFPSSPKLELAFFFSCPAGNPRFSPPLQSLPAFSVLVSKHWFPVRQFALLREMQVLA